QGACERGGQACGSEFAHRRAPWGNRGPARRRRDPGSYPHPRARRVTGAARGQPAFSFPGRSGLEAADGVVREVVEAGVLAEELELDRARGAVSLLADDDLGQALVGRILLVVVLV